MGGQATEYIAKHRFYIALCYVDPEKGFPHGFRGPKKSRVLRVRRPQPVGMSLADMHHMMVPSKLPVMQWMRIFTRDWLHLPLFLLLLLLFVLFCYVS